MVSDKGTKYQWSGVGLGPHGVLPCAAKAKSQRKTEIET